MARVVVPTSASSWAEGRVVVDTGMGTRNAETVLSEVAKVGAGKPIYIVTTHVHPSTTWAPRLPEGSKLIRSKSQVEDIAAGAA
jgi:hypothetical protein